MNVISRLREKYFAKPIDYANHPERLVLLPYCTQGRGIEVGCGWQKTHPNVIGVDILPNGEIGKDGCMANKVSVADICASGDNLPMFHDNELDFIIGRHVLEHFVDVFKALEEWKRILRIGGTVALVVPDETTINTIVLDPTHKHAFTPDSLKRYFVLLGFDVQRVQIVIENWSFLIVATRV